MATGAIRCHVLDVREEFARDYVLPALQAGALYEERYPLATALSRPLIAKKLVEIAQMENATAIAHGCTGKGNDQVRIEVSVRAIDPTIAVIAPARVWGMTRPEEIEYARVRNVPVPTTKAGPYSTDQNLWGRSIEGGELEDPWTEPPDEIYTLTKSPAQAPETPAYVEIEWEKGVPTAVNGVAMPLTELIDSLETIAGVHGVGRIDMVENRLVGIKSREIYEAPAAIALHTAHRDLEGLVVSRDLQRLKQRLSQEYADFVYNGLWFSPTREAIDAFVQNVQQRVTGTVRLKLFKGDCRVVGRKSPFALYDHGLATYDDGDRFDHSAAEGFIKIWGLPVETAAKTARRREAGPKPRSRPRRPRSSRRWPTSGQDVSAASPIQRRSSSGRRSDSTSACSKTTSPAVSRGWMRSRESVSSADAEAEMVAAALDRHPGTRPSRSGLRRRARTKTCTRSSSASSSSGSGISASGFTPVVRATNRSPSICACISGDGSRSFSESWRGDRSARQEGGIGRRCGDAVLHAPPPRDARSGRALLSRARVGAPPRLRAPELGSRRRPTRCRSVPARSPAPITPSIPRRLRLAAWFLSSGVQQHRRVFRSRLRCRVPVCVRR